MLPLIRDGTEVGPTMREQILPDALDCGGLCIAHSHKDRGRLSQLESHQCIIDTGLLYCCRVSLLKERKNARGEIVLDEGIGNTIGLDFASLCSTSCLRLVKSNRLKITSVGPLMQRLLCKSQ